MGELNRQPVVAEQPAEPAATIERVAELDLRRADPAAALKLLDDLWDTRDTHTGRVLVIDETELLVWHEKVFARLRSPLVRRLLCVAVGRRDGAAGFELPGPLLAGQDAGMLWVPDPDGHDWRLGGPTLAAHPGEPGSGLAGLRELLRIPEVFDRTAELAAAVPGGVSNPGLRLSAALPDEAEFSSALLTAIDELLRPGVPVALDGATVDALGRPGREPERETAQETTRETARETVRLRAESPLDAARQRAERAVTTACRTAGRLGGPSSLLLFSRRDQAAADAADAGRAMADMRSGWATLFAKVPVDAEPLPGQIRLVREQGVLLSAPEGADPRRVRTSSFGAYVAAGLARGWSLDGLANGLREQQRRLVPPRLDPKAELDRACPPGLLARLRGDTPLPPPESWLPVPGLVAALLAGLGWFGPGGGFAVAVLYTVLVGLTLVGGPGAPPAGGAVWVAATGAAGSVGALAAGAVNARLPAVPAVAAVLVAVAGTVAAVLWSWRSRCRGWSGATGLDEAPAAVADLRAAAARLAAGWSQAAHGRDGVADLMRGMAAVDGAREALRQHAATLRARGPRAGARPELLAAVRGHLNDVVQKGLQPRRRSLPAEPPRAHQTRASAAIAELIAAWEGCVTRDGALESPPPAPATDIESSPVSKEDLLAIRDDVTHWADAVMWQLIGPSDLPLLRAGDGRPPCVRFAPRAIRTALSADCPADTLWVRSSRHAGALRLVPVRPDQVRQCWSSDDPWETP